MKNFDSRTRKRIARTAVVFTTTGIASLALASPVSAGTVIDQAWSVNCPGNMPMGDCDVVQVPFATANPRVKINVTQGDSYCARSIAEVNIDGQNHPSLRIGGGWQQAPLDIGLASGNHTIRLNFRSLSDCKDGVPKVMSGRLQIEDSPRQVKDFGFLSMRVDSATDVYDKPEHQGGQPIFVNDEKLFLQQGSEVRLVSNDELCQPDAWCAVKVAEAPGGQGVVWGGDLSPKQ